MSKNNRIGIVYSTNADFEYQTDEVEEPETLEASEQKLKVSIDRKQRKGKVVTLVSGFVGKQSDLEDLSRMLKTACGCGGSAKDGLVIIQGEMLEKVRKILLDKGYSKTK
ncbi:MAG: translation initiation factor [Bacteroidales bacterium]|nr:translation initiation factor [Bacteroidales bacterium]